MDELSAIAYEELKARSVYVLRSRNLKIGAFSSLDNSFIGIRTKFNSRYLAKEYHYKFAGTAITLEKIAEVPDDIPMEESLGTECYTCKSLLEYKKIRNLSGEIVIASYRNDGDKRFPNTETGSHWVHLNGTDCGYYQPVSIPNIKLFDFLKSQEEDYDRRRS